MGWAEIAPISVPFTSLPPESTPKTSLLSSLWSRTTSFKYYLFFPRHSPHPKHWVPVSPSTLISLDTQCCLHPLHVPRGRRKKRLLDIPGTIAFPGQ